MYVRVKITLPEYFAPNKKIKINSAQRMNKEVMSVITYIH